MTDYKATLNLPHTDFPMKAGLSKREPERLAQWRQQDLYQRIRENAARCFSDGCRPREPDRSCGGSGGRKRAKHCARTRVELQHLCTADTHRRAEAG